MEATGGLERRLAHALIAAGHQVRVLNPKRVRDFAKSLGRPRTTASTPAGLPHFAATIPGPPIERNEARERLDEMATVRRFLSDQLIAARNHARHAELPAMRTVLARQIRGLREDIKRVDGAIDARHQG